MPRTLLPLLALAALATSARAAERPNIVLIFSDDHAYQAISAYGDKRKLLDTPHIDRIAKEGVRFNRCLVPNSICGPSRATVLTGKYSHLNGFYNNTNSRFDGSQVTFPKLLQKAGYQTAIVGKWHLGSDPAGFDYWHILPGQGVYYNPPMIDNGKRVKHDGYTTDIISKLSIDWLRKRDRKKPFLLMTQHKAPHRAWDPALRHLGHDKDRKYPEPPTLFDDYANRGPAVRDQDMTLAKTYSARDAKFVAPALTPEQRKKWDAYYVPRNKAFREAKLEGKELVRWRYNRYMHDYLGCIKAVDEAVGDLLKFLDDEGLGKNTLVVYCADQGFYLGEHGWFDKRWIFEESLRTPLLVRWPGVAKAGHVDGNLASTLDLAQTFLDAAGVPADKGMQGASLVPLLKGEKPKDWRKSFYYEYFEYPQPHRVMPHYGVVTDRYKLARFFVPTLEGKPKVDYWELYDREKDPLELKDFSKAPGYAEAVKELKAEVARLRKELKVPDPIPKEAYGGLLTGAKRGDPAKVKHALVWRLNFDGKDKLSYKLVKAKTEKGELVLEGEGHAALGRPKYNPAYKPITVGARVWLDGPGGVIVAQGGESHGFALYVEKNEPVFAVRSSGKLTVARAGKKLARGRWFHVVGEVDAGGKMRVWVDGKEGKQVQGGHLTRGPADGLSLGADTGSWVGEYKSDNPFTGRLRDVRLYWGLPAEKELQKWAGLGE